MERETVPCPDCDRGTKTDCNGARWRCGSCGGHGRIFAFQCRQRIPCCGGLFEIRRYARV